MCSARHAEDKKRYDKLSWEQTLSLDTTDTCIVHMETKIARQPKLTSRKGEKQQRRRDASACGKEQPRQRGSTDKLDYTSRFVRVIPTLSQHCRKTVT